MRTARRLFSAWYVAAALAIVVPALVTPALATAQSKPKTTSAAAANETKPKNATAQCKDGTYSTAKTRQGACSKHGGVATWYADAKDAPKTESAPAAKTPPTAGKGTAKPAGDVPKNATAKCKDGTYSFAAQHSGACSHHGGVGEWYK